MGTRRGRQWIAKRQNSAGAGGSGSSALLSVLPGGPSTSQIANPAGLTDTKGNQVTASRSTSKYARTGTSGDPSNLCLFPEQIDQWFGIINNAVSVTGNASAAPDGTITAAQVTLTAPSEGSDIGNGSNSTSAIVPATGVHTASIYLRAGTATDVTLKVLCPSSGFGVRGLGTFSLTSAWQRFTITTSSNTAGDRLGIFIYSATSTGTLFAWGGKLEAGSSATAYISPMLRSIPANVPSVEPEGLLVEGATTNLILQSEDFTSASWGKNGVIVLAPTITADVAIAPNGTLTADQIALPSVVGAGAASVVSQGFTATAASYTASVYLRSPVGAGTKTIYLAFTDNATIPTQYKGTTACTVTETGWTRFSCTATLTAATWFIQAGVDLRDGGQLTQGAQAVYAWGAQVEALPFASSYVPTTTVTASRGGDTITSGVFANVQTQGSAFCSFMPQFTGTIPGANIISAIADSALSAIRPLAIQGSTTLSFQDGNAADATAAVTYNSSVSIAIANRWSAAANQKSISVNGGAAGTAAFSTLTGVTSPQKFFSTNAFGWLKAIKVSAK